MAWRKPHFDDISMSSEIGAYQDDFGGDDMPLFMQPADRRGAVDSESERQGQSRE